MINEHTLGHIVDIDEGGTATIKAVLPNIFHACDRKYDSVEIILPDGRRISPEQRRKCYALIGEIAEYVDGVRNAETIDDTKSMMKWEFILHRMESQERQLFSLSNCDVTTARNFIDYLVWFCVKNDIPMKISPLEYCEDIAKYIYACLVNKKCCICGKPADLHHVQSVGSQGYRDKINHIGLDALPLCREHHTASHAKGQIEFMKKYHLQPIKIDQKIARLYKLNKGENDDSKGS
jgi:hypothetical protein